MNWENVDEWLESESDNDEGVLTQNSKSGKSQCQSESWDFLRRQEDEGSSEIFDDKDSWSVVSSNSECRSWNTGSSLSMISTPPKEDETVQATKKDELRQQLQLHAKIMQEEDVMFRELYDDESFWEKPNTGKLRKKHEKGGRRRTLKGHTGRRIGYMSSCSLPVIEGGNKEYLTAIETEIHQRQGEMGRYTGTPGPYKYFLDKNQEWEKLPAILERESVEEPGQMRSSGHYGYHKVTTYKLRPKQFVPSANQVKFDRFIYFKPRPTSSMYSAKFTPRKIFAEVQTEPPHFVKGRLLNWTFNNPQNPRNVTAGNKERPLTRKNKPVLHGKASWDVEIDGQPNPATSMRAFLEIDLGETQVITAVSTQGGNPPVRRYPRVSTQKNARHLRLSTVMPPGHCRVEGHLHKGEYTGPFWNVLDPDWKVPADNKGRRESKLRWVHSYELLWRADRGKAWNSLGVFKGNDDTTTEKAHLLTGFNLRCRYLRFVPMESENGGAMRVGVYGSPKTAETSARKSNKNSIEDDNAMDDIAPVEYRFHHASDVVPQGALHRDACTWSGKDWYYPKNYQKRTRQDLKKQAIGSNHSKVI